MAFDPLLDDHMNYRGLRVGLAAVLAGVLGLLYAPGVLKGVIGLLSIAVGWASLGLHFYDARQESQRLQRAKDEFNARLQRSRPQHNREAAT